MQSACKTLDQGQEAETREKERDALQGCKPECSFSKTDALCKVSESRTPCSATVKTVKKIDRQ
jgi:hypothetical protein